MHYCQRSRTHSRLTIWKSSLWIIKTSYFAALWKVSVVPLFAAAVRVCVISFGTGMTLRPERTCRRCSVAFFAEHLRASLSVSSSLKRSQLQFSNIKRLATFSFACGWVRCTSQHKCQRSHIFGRIDESFLRGSWSPYGSEDSRQRIQVSARLSCYISEQALTECLLVVKTWRCWLTFVKWAQNLMFPVTVIFKIQMVCMELLANCEGENLLLSKKWYSRLWPSLHLIAVARCILLL